jgi:hypothetical protein
VQITSSRLELGMTEQHLDGAQVDTVIQEMGRETVPSMS